MTGPEHYREAEKLAAQIENGAVDWESLAPLAQVHATLALAAATALSGSTALPITDWQEWYSAAATPQEVTRGRA